MMSLSVLAARRSGACCAVLALVLLAPACQRRSEPATAVESAERAPPQAVSEAGPPGFVGRWALTPSACGRQAWVLSPLALRSPSVLSCSFERVSPIGAGYAVDTVCTVGKAKAQGRLVFTLTGQGASRALTMSGGPFTEPMALAHCPGDASLQSASIPGPRGG
jgi:hypothetical protein